MMYAVIRETSFPPGTPIYETEEFQEFQRAHAGLRGYEGTVVVEVGPGRFITVTLWETAKDRAAGLEAMGPIVQGTITPLMDAPAKLIGTGPVVYGD